MSGTRDEVLAELQGELTLHGRIAEASNGAYLGQVGDQLVIYKPIRAERPLWDFPGAVLAHREVAAFWVSEVLGWAIVPPTVLRAGPMGPGMVQRWCDPDPDQAPVDIVAAGTPPAGMLHVFDGLGAHDEPVQLVHEDTPALLRMAVFDVVINNADRKGGHILAMADGHRFGIDHGIALHHEPKLRSVLWGWAGRPVPTSLLTDLTRLHERLRDTDELDDLLAVAERQALADRTAELLRTATMPHPSGEWPAIPWPPF